MLVPIVFTGVSTHQLVLGLHGVLFRSYVWSTKEACALVVGTLIGRCWWCTCSYRVIILDRRLRLTCVLYRHFSGASNGQWVKRIFFPHDIHRDELRVRARFCTRLSDEVLSTARRSVTILCAVRMPSNWGVVRNHHQLINVLIAGAQELMVSAK
jgi:hypothetical protein